jgi:hypothetical protein
MAARLRSHALSCSMCASCAREVPGKLTIRMNVYDGILTLGLGVSHTIPPSPT